MFKSPFIILAALGVISLGGYFMFKTALNQAALNGTLKCELNQATQGLEAAKEAATQRKVKRHEVNKLDDADLRKRYCVWVRDIPYDECIRTVVFVD